MPLMPDDLLTIEAARGTIRYRSVRVMGDVGATKLSASAHLLAIWPLASPNSAHVECYRKNRSGVAWVLALSKVSSPRQH